MGDGVIVVIIYKLTKLEKISSYLKKAVTSELVGYMYIFGTCFRAICY